MCRKHLPQPQKQKLGLIPQRVGELADFTSAEARIKMSTTMLCNEELAPVSSALQVSGNASHSDFADAWGSRSNGEGRSLATKKQRKEPARHTHARHQWNDLLLTFKPSLDCLKSSPLNIYSYK